MAPTFEQRGLRGSKLVESDCGYGNHVRSVTRPRQYAFGEYFGVLLLIRVVHHQQHIDVT